MKSVPIAWLAPEDTYYFMIRGTHPPTYTQLPVPDMRTYKGIDS